MKLSFVLLFLEYSLILITSYFSSFFIYTKTSNIKLSFKKIIILIILCLILSSFCVEIRILGFSLYRTIFLTFSFMSLLMINKSNYIINTPKIIISIGISYGFEIFSVFFLITPFYLLGYYDVNVITQIISSSLQILLTILFVKIKRIKNGFSFFDDTKNFGIGLLVSGPIIILTSLQKETMLYFQVIILFFGLMVSSIGLLIWIRSAITHHYRKRLKLRAEEYSKIELAEKNKEIERLTKENTSLSSIIHLDNHLIYKLEATLNNYKNDESINDLLTLSKQRNEYVNNKIINEKLLPTTGNNNVDTVISDMYIKAASRGIDFTLNVDCDINYLIHNIIDQTDFEKLIRCCITNSIVDIESDPDTNGKILFTISKPNDIYEFTIMDNGASKEDNIKSISEIIEKSKASIKTNHFDNNDSFTKSLTIRFDG